MIMRDHASKSWLHSLTLFLFDHFISGYRLSKFTLFLVGFLLAFFFTYVLCNEYLSTDQLSGKTLEYKDQVL